jgi:hypothetical protein
MPKYRCILNCCWLYFENRIICNVFIEKWDYYDRYWIALQKLFLLILGIRLCLVLNHIWGEVYDGGFWLEGVFWFSIVWIFLNKLFFLFWLDNSKKSECCLLKSWYRFYFTQKSIFFFLVMTGCFQFPFRSFLSAVNI